jgi:ubiquinone/menaquinone biosynthesis C-methylase UbiE
LKYSLVTILFNSVLLFLTKGLGFFWPTPDTDEADISWERGRQRIYQLGIDYWRKQIELLGIEAPGGRVLDVGSGNGQWLIAYAQDSAEVIGVEPDERIREFSLKKIAEWPERTRVIKVVASRAENLPFRDDYFDHILCAGVFMFTNQDRALREMSRVLRPGGRMCLTVNGLGYFIMYILNGLRYKSVSKMSYGLRGFTATLLKWWLRKELNQPKAVNRSEMKKWLARYGLSLYGAHIYLQQDLYPEKHLGFPTNYAFMATKNLN